VAKLNASASELNYASFLGGSSNDSATALALDNAGNAYITGTALSTDFPVTQGAFQSANQAAAAKASNAFISEFDLGAENNQTSYKVGIPSQGIPTTLTLNWAEWIPGNDWALGVSVNLNSGGPGPPPTGQITVTANGALGCCFIPAQLPGTSWTGVTADLQAMNYPNGNAGPGDPFQVIYSGDPIYQSSTVTGPACIVGQTCPFEKPARQGLPPVQTRAVPADTSTQKVPSANIPSAKFALPQPTRSGLRINRASAASAACIAPSNLTITLKNSARLYGAANPTFGYTVTGLLSGDTITVTPSTTATAASGVGAYPIIATVTGSDLVSYAVTVVDAVLTVTKAPLYISTKSVNATYGQNPSPLTGYELSGFVNGDTASVVTGAPVLTTTVSTTTPVGAYLIGVHTGTLTAHNYYFNDFSNGEGHVYVRPAILTIHPASFTIHVGDPLPAFTYTLSGFVNEDTQATATTGAAVLYTTAPNPPTRGRYYIIADKGTLRASNYVFQEYVSNYGILTVLP